MDANTLDLQTRVVNALVDHWPLVVGLLAFAKWGFPYAMREHGHLALSSLKGQEAQKANMVAYFNNGGGDKMREIVRTENAVQTELHKNETSRIVEAQLRRHEEDEERRFRGVLEEFESEITDRYDLRAPRLEEPRPRRRRRR